MIKRRYYDKIPLQGNVYPMPSLVYIQDSLVRVNVISNQPLGVTSKHSGLIDVFLDRRLLQDDQRGVGQGLTDNRRTNERFRIVVEALPQEALKPSLKVQHELLKVLNDYYLMESLASSNQGEIAAFKKSLPCDVHLLNLRSNIATMNEFNIFFHRFGVSCEQQCSLYTQQSFCLADYLNTNILNAIESSANSMSLSLMEETASNISLLKDNITLNQIDFAVYSLKLK